MSKEDFKPNYYGMWAALKKAIEGLATEDGKIYVSDLETAMDTIELDESH